MAADTARIRIGRVRMKNGGADVRVISPPSPRGHTIDEFRKFQHDVMGETRAPDALCAVAIWLRPEHPAYPTLACAYASTTPAILTGALPELMARYVRQRMTTWQAESQVMEELGYTYNEPDDSA